MVWKGRTTRGEGAVAPRRGRPWRRLLFALALLLLAAVAAVWLQRRTLARDFIDRELGRRGIVARYEITQLSPWRQRLEKVVIGDPRHPDLTADWLEVRTAIAPWRAEVLAIRAGKVRLRGRVVDGRVSLGAIDRLMPAGSGKPFVLPALIVDIGDLGMSLDSPAGTVQLAVAGKGMLNNGFAGTLRMAAPHLALAGCTLTRSEARIAVRIRDGRPSLEGPLSAAQAQCGATRLQAAQLALQAELSAALNHWQGQARLRAGPLAQPGLRVASLHGTAGFEGDIGETRGQFALRSGAFELQGNRGTAAALAGRYAAGRTGARFAGQAQLRNAALAAPIVDPVRRPAARANVGPLQPIVAALARSVGAAARAFDADADLSLAYRDGKGAVTLSRARMRAASGGRIDFDGEARIAFGEDAPLPRAAGTLALGGGGLPEAVLRVTQQGDRTEGTGAVQPYAVGTTRLAVSDLRFALRGGSGTASAVAEFSGALPQGWIEQLRLPLDAAWAPESFTLNPHCIDAGFRQARLGSLVLDRHSLSLCPVGGAMVRLNRGRIGGGVLLTQPRLAGTLDGSPLQVAAEQARLDLTAQRFALSGGALRLGPAGETRLDLASLSGSLAGDPDGSFSGLAGQMGSVPLLVSAGVGAWQLRDGTLALAGGLQIRDAAAEPRFHPLTTENARIRVAGTRIEGGATLNTLAGSAKVAELRLAHDLNAGTGSAEIAVDGLRFAEQGLQPQDLTPLTYGVIAEVKGAVSGKGRIAWSGNGVTSSGTFGTDGIDLAAAFGPVRGLATTLHFTDLLAMRTASGESATVAEINPGVPVTDGALRFQVLDSQRVQVEGGRWPFAGGELVLEPTLLDFSERRERRLTFRVIGADAALFLKEMAFDNISATGTFDGTLPMVFDEQGGRIEGGRIEARAGGSIAYVGEVSRHDLGLWGNMAFQALRALDYRSLSIGMNGPLAGDMVTDIRFAGVSQGKGAKSNFVIRRLARLPFVFNIRISAPFQQLLSSVQSWYDPSRLIERNLPALLEEQDRATGAAPVPIIQQPESQSVRSKEQK